MKKEELEKYIGELSPELQEKAVKAHKNAALLNPEAELLERAESVIEEMERHFSDNKKALEIIGFEKEKISGRKVCNCSDSTKLFK